MVLTPQKEKWKENRFHYNGDQKSHRAFMIPVWYSRSRAPNFVFHLEMTHALFVPATLVHLRARTLCRKTIWAGKGTPWGGGGETATGGCHNCTSVPLALQMIAAASRFHVTSLIVGI